MSQSDPTPYGSEPGAANPYGPADPPTTGIPPQTPYSAPPVYGPETPVYGAPPPAYGAPPPVYGAPPYGTQPYGSPYQSPYGTQPYGSPYQAPAAQPYGGYGYPPYYPAPVPPAPRRSPIVLIVVVVVAALLVSGGVVAAVVYNNRETPRSTGAGLPSATGAGPASPTPTSSSPFSTPDTIGPLTRSSDQTEANALVNAFPRVMRNAFAVMYDDPRTTSRHLLVGGGNIPVTNPTAQMNGFFAGAVAFVPGSKGSNRRTVGTGSAGGLAQCETITGGPQKLEICGWLGDDALIEMLFLGYDRATVDPLVPTVLNAVTT